MIQAPDLLYHQPKALSIRKHVGDSAKSLGATLTAQEGIPSGINKMVGHASRAVGRVTDAAGDLVNVLFPGKTTFVGNVLNRWGNAALGGRVHNVTGMISSGGDILSNLRNGEYRKTFGKEGSLSKFLGYGPIGAVRDLILDPLRGANASDYQNYGRNLY